MPEALRKIEVRALPAFMDALRDSDWRARWTSASALGTGGDVRAVPALVWGGPGTGKSTFVESLARDGFAVLTMIACLQLATRMKGSAGL